MCIRDRVPADVVEVVGDGAAHVRGLVAVEGVQDGQGRARVGDEGGQLRRPRQPRPGALAGEAAHVRVRVVRPRLYDGQGAGRVGAQEGAYGGFGGQPGGEVVQQRQPGLERLQPADGDGLVDGEGHPALEGGVGEGGADDGLEAGPVRGEVGEHGVADGGDAAAVRQPVEGAGAGAQGGRGAAAARAGEQPGEGADGFRTEELIGRGHGDSLADAAPVRGPRARRSPPRPGALGPWCSDRAQSLK